MIESHKKNDNSWFQWLALGLLAVIVCVKWTDFSLPLFWDELGVYGPGILYMLDHGVGILPDSLPPELSRGHPLLFYALFASIVKITGYSLMVMHLIAMTITILWILSIKWIGARIYGQHISTIGYILVLFAPNVIAQGAMVLPEIFLGLVCLWALYFFYTKKYTIYFAGAVVALMTKETALVLLVSTAMYGVWENKNNWIKAVLRAMAPVTIYLIFLIIQKSQHGWYFFPLHVDLISWVPADILRKLGIALQWLFLDQGRFVLLILIGFLGVLNMSRITALFSSVDGFSMLATIFFVGILAFTCLNVYMDRYLILLMPFWAWLIAGSVLIFQKFTRTAIYNGAFLISCFLYFSSTFWQPDQRNDFRFDVNLDYRDMVRMQQLATDYLVKNMNSHEPFYANFPFYNGFLDARYGYVDPGKTYHPTVSYQDNLNWAVVMVPPFWAERVKPEGRQIESFQKDFIQIDIYQKVDSSIITKTQNDEPER